MHTRTVHHRPKQAVHTPSPSSFSRAHPRSLSKPQIRAAPLRRRIPHPSPTPPEHAIRCGIVSHISCSSRSAALLPKHYSIRAPDGNALATQSRRSCFFGSDPLALRRRECRYLMATVLLRCEKRISPRFGAGIASGGRRCWDGRWAARCIKVVDAPRLGGVRFCWIQTCNLQLAAAHIDN